ncbi:hypothetical protein CU044_5762 [Streptomyces sp. L-9-10]|nr:hypothetical protein CU044_5762 [Streptomyces sp. L-9-10]
MPDEVTAQALDGGAVEHVRVVREGERQSVAAVDDEIEGVVGGLVDHDLADLQAVPGGAVGVDGGVLEDHQAVEQRLVGAQFAECLDAVEGEVVVAAGLDLLALQPLQPLHHRTTRIQPHPHRKRVDEQPHHVLGTIEISGPARGRRAEHHITLTTATRKQQRPQTLHHGIDGQPMPPRKRKELTGQFLRQLHLHPLRRTSLTGMNSRPVIRQRHRRVKTRQTSVPELFRHPHITPRHPPRLNTQPTTTHHHRQHQPIPPRRIVVQHERHHPRQTPAVEQDVVEGEQHADTVVREPGQGQPGEGHGAQVQTALPVGGDTVRPECGVLGCRGGAPVQDLDGQRDRLAHHLHRLAHAFPHDPDAQRLYLVDHALPGRGEPVDVGHTVDGEHQLLEVRAGAILGEGVEEHPGLQRHQRQDILDTTPVTDRRVQTRLIQRRQRKVRRRDTTGTRQLTMREKALQLPHERRRQPLHHLVGEHTGRPDQVDNQPPADHAGRHIQRVGPGAERAVLSPVGSRLHHVVERILDGRYISIGPGPAIGPGPGPRPGPVEAAVADLRTDRTAQVTRRRVGIPEVAQRAVPMTMAGYPTQPLLRGLDEYVPVGRVRTLTPAGSRAGGSGSQLQREDRTEPAHRP